MTKRKDYISWDEFFMGVAELASGRSKDPNTQVGACIIDNTNHILSTGYNGMPIGMDDDVAPWSREGDFMATKYAYVCHAELNAILNANGKSLVGAILYVTCYPCNECAKAIVQAGISKVVFLEDKYPNSKETRVSRMIFDLCEVETVLYTGLYSYGVNEKVLEEMGMD